MTVSAASTTTSPLAAPAPSVERLAHLVAALTPEMRAAAETYILGLLTGTHPQSGATSALTDEEALQEFEEDYGKDVGRDTRDTTLRRLRAFRVWLTARRQARGQPHNPQAILLEATADEVAAHLGHLRQTRGHTSGTLSHVVGGFSSFYKWAIAHLRWPPNRPRISPVTEKVRKTVKRVKGTERRATAQHIFTLEEARRFLHLENRPDVRLQWGLGFKLGLRVGEIVSLEWAGVDLQGRRLTIPTHPKRTMEDNYILPIDHELARLFELWRENQEMRGVQHSYVFPSRGRGRPRIDGLPTAPHVSESTVERFFKRHAARCGIRPGPGEKTVNTHAMRHTLTTYLRREGCPDRAIAWVRGDSKATTADTYDQLRRPGCATDPEAFQEGKATYEKYVYKLL